VARDDVLQQEVEHDLGLGVLQALDLRDELAIDEEALLARHGVHADQRMHRVDRVLAHQAPARAGVRDHLLRRMHGLEVVEEGAESRRETSVSVSIDSKRVVRQSMSANILVCSVSGREDGVPTDLRTLQQPQHHVPRRLDLVADILVPERGRRALLEELRDLLLVAVAVDDVESREASDGARDGLVVRLAEVPHELLLARRTHIDQILIGEGDNLALRDQQGQLVLGGVRQLAQLHALHDAPQMGLDMRDLDAGREQVGLGFVLDPERGVLIVEWGQRIEPDLVPGGQVLGVLGAGRRLIGDADIRQVDVVADGCVGIGHRDGLRHGQPCP